MLSSTLRQLLLSLWMPVTFRRTILNCLAARPDQTDQYTREQYPGCQRVFFCFVLRRQWAAKYCRRKTKHKKPSGTQGTRTEFRYKKENMRKFIRKTTYLTWMQAGETELYSYCIESGAETNPNPNHRGTQRENFTIGVGTPFLRLFFAYAKRELRNEWRFEAFLPSLLQSIRCKQKAVDRWLADLHVTPLSVWRCGLLRPMTDHCTLRANGFVLMGMWR